MEPIRSATMFYSGGAGVQPGLLQTPGWQVMPLIAAAQAVPRNAFPAAYARWEAVAAHVVGNPTIYSATCLTSPEFVDDGTVGARAVVAAMRWIGTLQLGWGRH